MLVPVELILDPELFDGVEGIEGVTAAGVGAGLVAGVGAGVLLIQTEGCPEQLQLFWILQLIQPVE